MTKEGKPNLELPQRPAKQPRSGVSGLVLALVLIVVILQVFSIVFGVGVRSDAGSEQVSGDLLNAEEHRALALRLEDKNLPLAAAKAWGTYLKTAKLEGVEAAQVLLQIGRLKQEAGQYQEAIHEYYLAEEVAENLDEEVARQISIGVSECFRKLGQYSELSREIAERATPGANTQAGKQIVATIGEDKLTVADFERLVRAQIDMIVKSQMGLTQQEVDAFRQRAWDQLADPKARNQQLYEIVVARVLADEARKQGVQDTAEFRERLVGIADGMLASSLLHEEVGKRSTVTDADVQRFFEANKQKYIQPGRATLARIVCATKEDADAVLGKLAAGEAFEELVKQHSIDEETKESAGVIKDAVSSAGNVVPGFGPDPELHKTIWETKAEAFLDAPYEGEDGWHILKVIQRQEPVVPEFEDIKDRVEYDTRSARRNEVTDHYIRELFDKAKVELHPEGFGRSQ